MGSKSRRKKRCNHFWMPDIDEMVCVYCAHRIPKKEYAESVAVRQRTVLPPSPTSRR